MTSIDIPYRELFTMRDWIRWSATLFEERELFFGHGTDNAFDEAVELVLATLHLSHDLSESWLEARVTDREARQIGERLRMRVEQRMPLAYVTGRTFFAGLEFEVNDHVLVPRSPIAELIQNHFQPWLGRRPVSTVLDLCCGSGCIGIASAFAFPDALVDLADISQEALDVAQKNIERHDLEDRVRAIRSDVFENLEGEKYDLIVSNPPYVSTAEMKSLPVEYLREPHLGLEAGEDGMDIVSRILVGAPDHLNPDGVLVVEVGASAELLMARYPGVPFLWLDLEYGGEGIFLLEAEQLLEFRDEFVAG